MLLTDQQVLLASVTKQTCQPRRSILFVIGHALRGGDNFGECGFRKPTETVLVFSLFFLFFVSSAHVCWR